MKIENFSFKTKNKGKKLITSEGNFLLKKVFARVYFTTNLDRNDVKFIIIRIQSVKMSYNYEQTYHVKPG